MLGDFSSLIEIKKNAVKSLVNISKGHPTLKLSSKVIELCFISLQSLILDLTINKISQSNLLLKESIGIAK